MKWYLCMAKKSGKWNGDKIHCESVMFQHKLIPMGRDCQIHC